MNTEINKKIEEIKKKNNLRYPFDEFWFTYGWEEAKKSYDDEIREKDKLLFELAHEKGNYSGQIINLKNELSNKDDEMKKNTPRLIIKDTDVRDIDKTADICIKLLQPIFGTLYVEKIFGDAQLKEEKGK
jgi:hypothetical protein